MDEAKIREDFEKSYLGGNKHTGRRNEHGDYVLPSIQDAWGGWRAAYELTWTAFMREATKTPNVEVSGLEKRSEATASTGRARP